MAAFDTFLEASVRFGGFLLALLASRTCAGMEREGRFHNSDLSIPPLWQAYGVMLGISFFGYGFVYEIRGWQYADFLPHYLALVVVQTMAFFYFHGSMPSRVQASPDSAQPTILKTSVSSRGHGQSPESSHTPRQ
jgi:hypothetical protein